MPIDSVTHLKATRAGRLLVVSYNAITKAAKYPRPHVTVFLEDGGPLAGNWSIIAQVRGRRARVRVSAARSQGACMHVQSLARA